MFSSLLALLTCLVVVIADLMDSTIYITTPRIVTAGSSFNATINVQWHGLADSSYAYAFRIYLGTSYKDQRFYWYDSECYLINEQSLCDPTIKISPDYIGFYDTPFTVTIPPTVGPSGKHYTLIGRIINTDGSYYGSTWESDVFELDGANGTWATYQESGRTLWGDDGIACTGFACVKECADAGGGTNNNATYEDCANACLDVHIDPSSSYGGQPTAALTAPSTCSQSLQATSASATRTATTGNTSTRSSSRTAAAAAATNVACSYFTSFRLTYLAPLLAVAVF